MKTIIVIGNSAAVKAALLETPPQAGIKIIPVECVEDITEEMSIEATTIYSISGFIGPREVATNLTAEIFPAPRIKDIGFTPKKKHMPKGHERPYKYHP